MFTQLLIVAVVAMLALAILRVARVQRGLSPLPEGSRRTSFLVGFVVLPPMVLGAILQPPPGGAPLGGIFWLPVYLLILGALKLLMTIVAGLLEGMTKGRTRRLLLIALVGNEGDPDDLPFNPPVTPRLAERMALVDRTNAAFPRGAAFPTQIERADFDSAWDALDDATRGLEAAIADDRQMGLGVATAATAKANDARGRLLVLRGIADGRGVAAVAS